MNCSRDHNTELEVSLIWRFCLYGFLKNQRYFEPFILLAFIEKGLSFFQIGLLFGFRSLTINLFEIPSGAAADLYGRIRTLMFSFGCYCLSFLVFAISQQIWQLFAAMFFFGLADAFRTGTHKAIIFDYLKAKHREDQKVRIYGLTRSFSQLGAALSASISAILVFWRGNYSDIFWLCAIPAGLNILNFWSYPKYLDGASGKKLAVKEVYGHVFKSFRDIITNSRLRALISESCGFEGTIKVVKDYNQVIIQAVAISLPFLTKMPEEKRTAVLVGIVYTILYICTSISSRQSWRIAKLAGNDNNAARLLWFISVCIYIVMAAAIFFDCNYLAISTFVVLLMVLNIWKPILVSRINSCCPDASAATTLSIDSQSKSFVAMILAPLIGFAVDSMGVSTFAVFGVVVSLFFYYTTKKTLY